MHLEEKKHGTIEPDLFCDIVEDEKGNFCVLGEGRFSKVYLLAIRHRVTEDIINYVAWKVQKDAYSRIMVPENTCNPDIDILWKQEHENLKKLRDTSHIVQLKDVVKLPPDCRQEEVHYLPPLWFCKKKRDFYPLLCPQCGKPLQTCTPELGVYIFSTLYENSEEQERVLVCKNCLQKEPQEITVYCGDELYKEEYIKRYADDKNSNIRFEFFSREEYLERIFRFKESNAMPHCVDCAHFQEKDRLCTHFKLFSFHNFHALPIEECHMPIRYFLNLISGKRLKEIRETMEKEQHYFKYRFPETSNLFRFPSNQGYQKLEILYLKLNLFRSLCLALKHVHEKLNKAHLHLIPENVMINLNQADSTLEPGGYSLKLIDLAGVPRIRPKLDEDIPVVYRKKHIESTLIPSEFLQDFSWEGTLKREEGQYVLNMGEVPSVKFQSLDWLRIETAKRVGWAQVESFDISKKELKITFWKKPEVEEDKAEEKEVKSKTSLKVSPAKDVNKMTGTFRTKDLTIDPKKILFFDRIDKARQTSRISQKEFEEGEQKVNFKYYPRCGPNFDLYGLGTMLFYILFGHRDQRRRISKRLRKVLDALDPATKDPQRKILELLSDSTLQKKYISFEDDEDKSEDGKKTARIPKPIWEKIILLGFKLLTTQFQDFSYYNCDVTEEKIIAAKVLPEIEEIIMEIESILFVKDNFYSQTPNDEIINSLRRQLARKQEEIQELEGYLDSFWGRLARKSKK